MKTIVNLLIVIFVMSSNILLAQEAPLPPQKPANIISPTPPPLTPQTQHIDKKEKDTTQVNLGNYKLLIIKKDSAWYTSKFLSENRRNRKRSHETNNWVHWSGFEMGVNGFMTSKYSTTLPKGYEFLDIRYYRSLTVNLNLWEESFNIYNDYVYFFTGLGIEWDNFKFSRSMRLVSGIDSIRGVSNNNVYDVNKLTVCLLNAPLMFEINTSHKPQKAFHLAGGLIVGYLLDSYSKETFNGEKFYQNSDFGMDHFRFSASLRAGIGDFNVFATYGINNMFKYGPDIHPFTVGITLVGL